MRGRKLSTLRAVPSSANGDYTLQWDLKDTAGRRVGGGMYIARFTVIDEDHRVYRFLRPFRCDP
ncbi:MAG: hypothetical protein HY318_17075 [Armatimonadetes bacterium]|nr:hypothetical protein [Armatimonadota bacterium]